MRPKAFHYWILWSLLFTGTNCLAMEFNWGQLTQTLPVLPESRLQFSQPGQVRCNDVYARTHVSNIMQVKMGGINPTSLDPVTGELKVGDTGKAETITIDHHSPVELYRQYFNEAIIHWYERYSEAGINQMRLVNDQLVPYRIQWFQYRFGNDFKGAFPSPIPKEYEGVASVRVFDSSTQQKVLGFPVNYDAPVSGLGREFKDPIELSPKNLDAGYVLPRFGRPEGEPVYSWHFGVGTNQKGFTSGLLSMLSHVAQSLDNFYNNAHFKTFKSTERVDDLGMVVYSSAKPDLISYYQKLGFEILDPVTGLPPSPVIRVHQNGQGEITDMYPTLPDGLFLFGMRAGDFLNRFYDLKQTPEIIYETPNAKIHISENTQPDSKSAEKVFFEGNLKAFSRVEKFKTKKQYHLRLLEIETMFMDYAKLINVFVSKHPEVHRMDRPEQEFFRGNQDWKTLVVTFRRFVLNFYSLVNNTPRSIRNKNWELAEQMARDNLTNYPLEGWNNFEPNAAQTRMQVFEALENLLR